MMLPAPLVAPAIVALAGLSGWNATGGAASANVRLRGRGAALAGRLTRIREGRGPLLVAAAGILLGLGFAPVATLVAVVTGYVLSRRWKTSRRMGALSRQQGEDVVALRALAAELRSGLAPAEALRAVAVSGSRTSGHRTSGSSVLGARMLAAADSQSLGGDPAAVLAAGAEPGSPTAALAAAWTVCHRTGARLAAPVGRVANGAAADLRISREAQAALAGARSSAHLLAALPVAGIVLGAAGGADSVHVLLATGIGQLCLVSGVALDLAGLAWLDRLAAAGA